MPRPLGFKVKDAKTGEFSASGIIGYHWSSVGRTWTNRAALGASIAVWAQRNLQYKNPRAHPEDWVVVMLTEAGLIHWAHHLHYRNVG